MDPLLSLPHLLQSLCTYGALSYYQINLSKSSALNISVDWATIDCLCQSFFFRWGVTLFAIWELILLLNLLLSICPILTQLRTDLLHWHLLTLTWFGRCSALKMTILPRVLYLLQAPPILLPPVFFKRVNFLFREFV